MYNFQNVNDVLQLRKYTEKYLDDNLVKLPSNAIPVSNAILSYIATYQALRKYETVLYDQPVVVDKLPEFLHKNYAHTLLALKYIASNAEEAKSRVDFLIDNLDDVRSILLLVGYTHFKDVKIKLPICYHGDAVVAKDAYSFLVNFINEYGYSPTLKELAEHLHCSVSYVKDILRQLVDSGLIYLEPCVRRSIRLVKNTDNVDSVTMELLKQGDKQTLRDLVYDYIRKYVEKYGYSPIQKEIARDLGCRQGSVSNVLNTLVSEGKLRHIKGKHRSLELVEVDEC